MCPRISQTDANSLVSTSQISVASSLPSTNAFQRGCVSQTISALGNDSRKPATAGKVWTISPSEPRRTTRKRGSLMRYLADGVEERLSGMILGIANDSHANAKPLCGGAFRHGICRVVGTFRVNVGPQFLE